MTDLVQKIADSLRAGSLVSDYDINAVREAIRRALADAGEPVAYACHIDHEEGIEPDACVLDTGRPQDCLYARKYGEEGRQKCGEWKPVKFAHPDSGRVAERSLGRAEAFALIYARHPETFADEMQESLSPSGPFGEWDTGWNAQKLREFLRVDDAAWSLIDQKEAERFKSLVECCNYKMAWSNAMSRIAALEQQLTESRERAGILRDAAIIAARMALKWPAPDIANVLNRALAADQEKNDE